MEGRLGRGALTLWAVGVVLFLWLPLGIILVYAFNTSNIQSWPIPGVTLRWFRVAWNDPDARDALLLSLKAAFAATAIALVLGTMAAVAISRFQFFGREIWVRVVGKTDGSRKPDVLAVLPAFLFGMSPPELRDLLSIRLGVRTE